METTQFYQILVTFFLPVKVDSREGGGIAPPT